jgi:hypothetical protein
MESMPARGACGQRGHQGAGGPIATYWQVYAINSPYDAPHNLPVRGFGALFLGRLDDWVVAGRVQPKEIP